MILKKDFLQALVGRTEKFACNTNEIEKIIALLQTRKKNVAKLFIIPGGLCKIPAKLQPFRIICKPASHSG